MRTLTTEQVKDIVDNEKAPVVNVLSEGDFERAHIPNTVNIPLAADDFVERVGSLVEDRDEAIVVYCAGPDCDASPKAAKTLNEAGFSEVYDYEGGMKEWIGAGHQVERAEEAALH